MTTPIVSDNPEYIQQYNIIRLILLYLRILATIYSSLV